MNQSECRREKESLKALHARNWPPELRKHVAVCSSCSELVLVAGLLRSDAARLKPNLPNAAAIWWKGQLARRRAAAARVTRFMGLSELLAVVVALGVAFAFLVSARLPFLRNEFFLGRTEILLLIGLITMSILLFLSVSYLAWKKE